MVEIYSKYLKALDELCDDISLGVPELLSHFRTTDPRRGYCARYGNL